MYIVMADDNYLVAEPAIRRLKKSFPKGKVEWIGTEHEFRTRLESFEAKPPDVIVMDVMLRWTRPSADMPDWPDDVKEEGFYTAGFRCEKLLSANEKLKNIPLIFYTVLENADLVKQQYKFVEGSNTYLQKSRRVFLRKEETAEPLVNLIRTLIRKH